MFEHHLRQPLTILGTSQNSHQYARPVLFHLQWTERHVEGAGLEQAFHGEAELFRRRIVQISLDLHYCFSQQTTAARAEKHAHCVRPGRLASTEAIANSIDSIQRISC